MWSVTSYYSIVTMVMSSFSDYGNKIVYKFPDSRIAAANSISENSFGNDFLFGVATSAYQIEGAWNESDKSPSIWDDFTHNHPELIEDHKNGDVAADSYHKYKEDIELVTNLGANAYRISLSWPRILPDGFNNRISETGVDYYNNVINEILLRGLTPVVTIYHWDLPKRIQDLGGWTNPFIVDWFVDYARIVFELFGDRVKIWATLNEPVIFCVRGYAEDHAPFIKQPGVADYLCGHYALIAHGKVYRLYEQEFRQKQRGKVGIVMSTAWPVPQKIWVKEEVEAAERYFEFWNGWFMHPIFHPDGDYPPIMRTRVDENSYIQGFKKSRLPVFTPHEIQIIKGSADYLGINFYSKTTIRPKPNNPMSISYYDDIGAVPIRGKKLQFDEKSTPRAFELMVHKFNLQYKIPMIYITENGYSDQGQLMDIGRTKYHHQHLSSLLNMLHYGVDIRGYFAWSLIDNFEWVKGYASHYGLFKVDFNDTERKRTAKLSTKIVRDIYKTKKIPKLAWQLEEVSFNIK